MATDTLVDYALLADVVREEIARRGFIPNSCILAARLAGNALRALGVSGVEAMACELDVLSPGYVEMLRRSNELGRTLTEAETDEFVAAGAWHVQLRFGPAPPGVEDRRRRGYNGHVVTLVDRAWMIDPTLPVANRPEKNLITEPPYAWAIDYDDARGHGHFSQSANGTLAIHRLLPGRKDFTSAPDWRMGEAGTLARILARLSTDWK